MSNTPFLTVFPDCAAMAAHAGGLEKASVTEVQVYMAEKRMNIRAWFSTMPSPAEIKEISELIREVYGLELVEIDPDYPNKAVVGHQLPAQR